MNKNATAIETLVGQAEDYGKTTLKLIQLKTIDKSADLASTLAVQFALTIIVALFILMCYVGLSLWLGEILGKVYYGFFIMSGTNILLFLLVYIFRSKWIKDPIQNSIIARILKHTAE
jgi:hypothetical protein